MGTGCRPWASVLALALALCLACSSALIVSPAPLAHGLPHPCGRALRNLNLVCYDPGAGDAAMTTDRLVKVLETSGDAPRLPACLGLQDREARVRLAQILRQGSALELVQQQFSDAFKDIGRNSEK
jgi:hypothetical protein